MGLVFLSPGSLRQGAREACPDHILAGMVAVVPAALIELPFRGYLTEPANLLVRFLVALFVIGLGEEAVKLLAVIVTAYSRAFNEPVDGIIYAVSASLGFAALENLFYTISYGIEVAPVRAIIRRWPMRHLAVSRAYTSASPGAAGIRIGVWRSRALDCGLAPRHLRFRDYRSSCPSARRLAHRRPHIPVRQRQDPKLQRRRTLR